MSEFLDNTRSMKMIFPKIKKFEKKLFFRTKSWQTCMDTRNYRPQSSDMTTMSGIHHKFHRFHTTPHTFCAEKFKKKQKIRIFLFWGISHLYEIMYLKNEKNILNIAIVKNFHKNFHLLFLDPRSLVESCSLPMSLNTESRISSIFW